MKENMIYGKSVAEYGAAGDGKQDDTSAFEAALSEENAYVVIPFGHYRITRVLNVRSGTVILAHPRAVIRFVGLAAKDAAGIMLSGGIWENTDPENGAAEWENVTSVRMEDMTVRSDSDTAVALCDVTDAELRNMTFTSNGSASGVIFAGNVKDARLKGLRFTGCAAGVEWMSGAQTENVTVGECTAEGCGTMFGAADAVMKNVRVEKAEGGAACAVSVAGCTLSDVTLRDMVLYDGFIYLCGNNAARLTVERVTRDFLRDTASAKPTLTIEKTSAALTLDGVTLDAVILSKKSVPDVKMDAKRMASYLNDPTSWRYVTSFTLLPTQCFTLPIGGFSALRFRG